MVPLTERRDPEIRLWNWIVAPSKQTNSVIFLFSSRTCRRRFSGLSLGYSNSRLGGFAFPLEPINGNLYEEVERWARKASAGRNGREPTSRAQGITLSPTTTLVPLEDLAVLVILSNLAKFLHRLRSQRLRINTHATPVLRRRIDAVT